MRSITTRRDYALTRRVQYLAEEFSRTLQFYATSHPDKPINRDTPLFITGSLADDIEVRQALSSAVGYKLETLVSPLQCPADLPLAKYAVNIGLALKKASYKKTSAIPNINILPAIYAPHRPPVRRIVLVPGILAGLAIIYPLYSLASSTNSQVYAAQIEYESLTKQIQLRQTNKKELDKIETTNAQMLRQISDTTARVQQRIQNFKASLQSLGSDPLTICYTLQVVSSDSVPAGIELTALTLDKEGGTIRGTAPSYEVALDYAYKLRDTGEFPTVWISPLSGAGTTDNYKVNFVITLGSGEGT